MICDCLKYNNFLFLKYLDFILNVYTALKHKYEDYIYNMIYPEMFIVYVIK